MWQTQPKLGANKKEIGRFTSKYNIEKSQMCRKTTPETGNSAQITRSTTVLGNYKTDREGFTVLLTK
jgi:hypothetical protein